jgi:hypothetical protein
MRLAIDHEATRPADPFAAVVVECDRLLPFLDQHLVDHVEHLEEGAVLVYAIRLVGLEAAVRLIRLPPYMQCQVQL